MRSSDGWEGEGVLALRGHTFKPRSAGTFYQRGDALESWPGGVLRDPRPSKPAPPLLRSEWKASREAQTCWIEDFLLWVCTPLEECLTQSRSGAYLTSYPSWFTAPGISLRVSDDMAQPSPPPQTSAEVSRGGVLFS